MEWEKVESKPLLPGLEMALQLVKGVPSIITHRPDAPPQSPITRRLACGADYEAAIQEAINEQG